MNMPTELHRKIEDASRAIIEARFGKASENSNDIVVYFDVQKRKAIGIDREAFLALCDVNKVECEGLEYPEQIPGCDSFWTVAKDEDDLLSVLVTIPKKSIGKA